MPTFMAPLHNERPQGPRRQPRPPPSVTRPLSTRRKPVPRLQESETRATMPARISHYDPIQLDLHDAISTQSRLIDDIAEFPPPPETAITIESFLRQECSTLKNFLAQAVETESSLRHECATLKNYIAQTVEIESSLRQEIETLKASLAPAKYDHKTFLAEHSAKPSRYMQEIAALKKSLKRAVDSELSLMREVETLKTTLTSALTSEREMRVSARQTREEWETTERSLREEIKAVRIDLERMKKELKGKKMVTFMQRVLKVGVRADKLGDSQQNVQAEERRFVNSIYLSCMI